MERKTVGFSRENNLEGLEVETESFEYEEGGGEVHHFQGRTRYPNIEGYPETGNNSWRADNDQAFIDACNNYNEKYGLSEGDDGYVSPKMLKAWAMVESGGPPDAFATDPLQVNNPGDWDDRKTDIAGLTQNQEMTPETSAEAALEWRRYKGYIHDETGTEHRDYYADLVLELGSD